MSCGDFRFCRSCMQVLCVECVTEKCVTITPEHKLVKIADIEKEASSSLLTSQKQLIDLKDRLSGIRNEVISKVTENYRAESNDLKCQIKKKAQDLHDKIRLETDSLCELVDEELQSKCAEVNCVFSQPIEECLHLEKKIHAAYQSCLQDKVKLVNHIQQCLDKLLNVSYTDQVIPGLDMELQNSTSTDKVSLIGSIQSSSSLPKPITSYSKNLAAFPNMVHIRTFISMQNIN